MKKPSEPQLSAEMSRKFDEDVYIPCELVDGDACYNNKKPIYQEDTGGKRLIGFEQYPDGECACGMAKVRKDVKHFLATALEEQRKKYLLAVEMLPGTFEVENDGELLEVRKGVFDFKEEVIAKLNQLKGTE